MSDSQILEPKEVFWYLSFKVFPAVKNGLYVTCGFVLISLMIYGQTNIPSWGRERFKKFADKYILSTHLQPQFLEADFSGDKKADLALFIERKIDRKKGILVLFGNSDQSFVLGAGNKLSYGGNNFDWAETWNVFREMTAYETTFKENGDIEGARQVELARPAIKITEKDGSGGLVYFDGKEFVWIHQGD